MLINSIYYGRTPISRVYRNGQIIWGETKEKSIDLDLIDIRSGVIARITSDALKVFELECKTMLIDDVSIKLDDSDKMFIDDISITSCDNVVARIDISDFINSDLNSKLIDDVNIFLSNVFVLEVL